MRHCTVIGAGLAGASAAWKLRRAGWHVRIIEALDEVGGNCRTSRVNGVTYERCGPHVFHTNNEHVYRFVSPWLNQAYIHTVSSETSEGTLSWPVQLSEVRSLAIWPAVERELASRPQSLPDARKSSFRDYVVAMMGETLYGLFIEGYTLKQWGQDPATLSAAFAPRRVDIRDDDYRPLFRDKYQGHLDVMSLIRELTDDCEVELGSRASWRGFLRRKEEPLIVTAPLDDFIYGTRLLEWRGMKVVHEYLPQQGAKLTSPVVNHPGTGCGFIRRSDASQMIRTSAKGTVISYEFPTGDAQAYPVNDLDGRNRELQRCLEGALSARLPQAVTAGRLATYSYIDMWQAIVMGWNAAKRIMKDARK